MMNKWRIQRPMCSVKFKKIQNKKLILLKKFLTFFLETCNDSVRSNKTIYYFSKILFESLEGKGGESFEKL